MSRIYVKNLPKNVTEDILRKHFGKIGQINDINLKYKNGTFRGFCFIGYEDEEFAQEACKQLNNSYIKKAKISVELAQSFSCTAANSQNPDDKRRFEYRIEKWDLSHKVRLWMDKGKNNHTGLRKQMIIELLKPLVPKKIFIPRKMKFLAYLSFDSETEMQQAIEMKDCFIAGNHIKMTPMMDGEDTQNSKAISPWQQAEANQKHSIPVSESAKIFVRNLSYTVTESDLREFFTKIGPIRALSLPISKSTSKQKGFAHISFMLPEHAVKALNLDGCDLKGRVMHIMPSNIAEDEEIENIPFQEKKDKMKKAKASSWHNWNTLFIDSNFITNIMANNSKDTTKLQMLERDDPNLAVKMALTETDIVNDTKEFLEENGVCLDAFTNPQVERSKNIILAKNLPENTTAEELNERFSKFGDINRILLPVHGLTAIIEFVHGDHAQVAFKKLAYRQFRHLPLYLEWAPVEIFKETKVDKKTKIKRKLTEENSEEVQPSEEDDVKSEDVSDSNASIYVKNINFSTTEETLKEFFSSCGKVKSAIVAKQNGLSQGYGFVHYYSNVHANDALLKLQGSTLEEHRLIVERSKKMTSDTGVHFLHKHGLEKNKKKSTNIMVKNIPFQATKKELLSILKEYGTVRTVRLPMKFDGCGEHRGFAFVNFSTIDEAERAMKSLKHSTHIYGRRLVLEWANEEESIEEVRKKTAEAFMASGPQKKKFKANSGVENYNMDML